MGGTIFESDAYKVIVNIDKYKSTITNHGLKKTINELRIYITKGGNNQEKILDLIQKIEELS